MSSEMDRPLPRNGLRSKYLPWLLAVGALGTAVLLAAFVLSRTSNRTLSVDSENLVISEVSAGTFRDFIPLNAGVTSKDVVFLDALEGGQVRQVFAQVGDHVTAGQPILEFRNDALELDVLEREARVIDSITQLQSYEKQLEQNRAANAQALARIDYEIVRLERLLERRDELAKRGFVPRAQQEDVRDELELNRRLRPQQEETNQTQEALRRRQLPQIQAQLRGLQASLAITRQKLEALVVSAPIAGRITAMDLRIGQNRNRGDRLAEITPATGLRLEAEIDQFYLNRVRAGLRGFVTLDGQRRELVVSRVLPQVTAGRFKVELSFVESTPERLVSGQTLQGRLALGSDTQALLTRTGPFLEKSGGHWMFVVSRDGREALRRPVRLGRRNAEFVEVLGGLEAGDRVVTSSYEGLEQIERLAIR